MTDTAPIFDEDAYQDPEPRTPRGVLTLDVYNICLAFANGETTLEEGKFMTPYVVMKIIMEDNPGRVRKPSTGAIAAVFKRWEESGFAEFRCNPTAFIRFTEEGKSLGLFGWEQKRAGKDNG